MIVGAIIALVGGGAALFALAPDLMEDPTYLLQHPMATLEFFLQHPEAIRGLMIVLIFVIIGVIVAFLGCVATLIKFTADEAVRETRERAPIIED